MNNSVHNWVGKYTTAESRVPAFNLVLGAEYRRGRIVTPLNQFENEMQIIIGKFAQQPLVQDENSVTAEYV